MDAWRWRSYSVLLRVGTLSLCPACLIAWKSREVAVSFNHQSRYSRCCEAASQKMLPLPAKASTKVRPRLGRNETIVRASRPFPPGYGIVMEISGHVDTSGTVAT